MSNDTIPRVIPFDEVRVGDTIRITDDSQGGVVYETTLTLKRTDPSTADGFTRFYYSEDRYALISTAATITLLERPKREIKVGDLVRRERRNGVTIEFTVHRVCDGFIYPAYDADGETNRVGYNPDHFEVIE